MLAMAPEFDHLALRVDLEQPWLAEVLEQCFGIALRFLTGKRGRRYCSVVYMLCAHSARAGINLLKID
jgi:hypothetical protein